MTAALSESAVEQAVLGWLGELKYAVAAGPDIVEKS